MPDFWDRLFKPLLEHNCQSQGHRITTHDQCFYCGKERDAIGAEIRSGIYHYDAIAYLEVDEDEREC